MNNKEEILAILRACYEHLLNMTDEEVQQRNIEKGLDGEDNQILLSTNVPLNFNGCTPVAYNNSETNDADYGYNFALAS